MAYFETKVLDNKIKELPTVDTASGLVATFDTDMTENLVSCVCDIDNSVSGIIVGYDYKYGGLLDFNQVVINGNFADTSGWYSFNSTFSCSSNICTVTPTVENSRIYCGIPIINGHKYFYIATMKGSGITAEISWYGAFPKNAILNDTWKDVATIINNTYNDTNNWQLRVGVSINTNLASYQIKNVMVIDLTQMFGSTLADEIYNMEQQTQGSGVTYVRNLLPNDYYAYTVSTIETLGTVNNDGTGETFNISFGETVSSGATYDAVSGLLTRNDTTTKKVDNCIIPTNNGQNYVMCDTNGVTNVKFLLSVGEVLS